MKIKSVREGAHCLRCGKLLSKGESIKRGYGNVCWSKISKVVRFASYVQKTLDDYK